MHFCGIDWSLFPCDTALIQIPIRVGQYSDLQGMKIDEIKGFEMKVTSNYDSLRFITRDNKIYLQDSSSAWVGKHPLLLSIHLKRNFVLMYVFPIVVVLAAILCYFLIFLGDTKECFVSLGVSSVVGIFFGLLKDAYYADVPNLLSLTPKANLYDLFFLILLVPAFFMSLVKVIWK